MKRRNCISNKYSGCSGGRTLSGVSADQDVTVGIADDSQVFLVLEHGESDLVTFDDGVLETNLDAKGTLGDGMNVNPRRSLDILFI